MKKNFKLIIFALVMVCVMVSLVACTKDQPADIYETLNGLLDKEYNSMTVSIETTQSMGTLTNTYAVSKVDNGTKVEYTCQQFAEFGEDYTVPANRIESKTGYVVYSNGNVVESSGDAVSVTLPQAAVINIDLNKDNLTDVQQGEGTFTASVVDPSALLQGATGCSDMTITVNYTNDGITSVVISYTTSSNMSVVATYNVQ